MIRATIIERSGKSKITVKRQPFKLTECELHLKKRHVR